MQTTADLFKDPTDPPSAEDIAEFKSRAMDEITRDHMLARKRLARNCILGLPFFLLLVAGFIWWFCFNWDGLLKTATESDLGVQIPIAFGAIICLAYCGLCISFFDNLNSTIEGQRKTLEGNLQPISARDDAKGLMEEVVALCKESPSCKEHVEAVARLGRDLVFAEYKNYSKWVEEDASNCLLQKLRNADKEDITCANNKSALSNC